MMHSRSLHLVTLAMATVLFSGCLIARDVTQTRRAFEEAYPSVHLERQVVLSLGPATIGLARRLTRLASDDDVAYAGELLRHVSQVQVGVYRADGVRNLDQFDLPSLPRFSRGGWQTALRVREEDSVVWMLVRESGGTVRELFVVVLSDDDFVVARVKGSLDELLAHALEQNGRLW